MKKRAMKKWIPRDTCYCAGCKWRHYIETIFLSKEKYKDNIKLKIKEDCKIHICDNEKSCDLICWSSDRTYCRELVYRCDYLNYTDYKQDSLLWDGCKECEIE